MTLIFDSPYADWSEQPSSANGQAQTVKRVATGIRVKLNWPRVDGRSLFVLSADIQAIRKGVKIKKVKKNDPIRSYISTKGVGNIQYNYNR